MNVPRRVVIDATRVVFPIVAGTAAPGGFNRTDFLGTGFFVGRHGLALSAAHVVTGLRAGLELRVGLPTQQREMRVFTVQWSVKLPGSDILVMRVEIDGTAYFEPRFVDLPMGVDVETTGIPQSMFEKDQAGRVRMAMRVAKGYVSHGIGGWIAANFPLPKGMSGSPLVTTMPPEQFVAGVFVGQNRGEQIEDQVEEVIEEGGGNGRRTQIERVSRVEYFARGELLAPHVDFVAPEFDGFTLSELIAEDAAP